MARAARKPFGRHDNRVVVFVRVFTSDEKRGARCKRCRPCRRRDGALGFAGARAQLQPDDSLPPPTAVAELSPGQANIHRTRCTTCRQCRSRASDQTSSDQSLLGCVVALRDELRRFRNGRGGRCGHQWFFGNNGFGGHDGRRRHDGRRWHVGPAGTNGGRGGASERWRRGWAGRRSCGHDGQWRLVCADGGVREDHLADHQRSIRKHAIHAAHQWNDA